MSTAGKLSPTQSRAMDEIRTNHGLAFVYYRGSWATYYALERKGLVRCTIEGKQKYSKEHLSVELIK